MPDADPTTTTAEDWVHAPDGTQFLNLTQGEHACVASVAPPDEDDLDGPISGALHFNGPTGSGEAAFEGPDLNSMKAMLVRVAAAYAGKVDQTAAIRKATSDVLQRAAVEWFAVRRVWEADLPADERSTILAKMITTFAEGYARLAGRPGEPESHDTQRRARIEAAARDQAEAAVLEGAET